MYLKIARPLGSHVSIVHVEKIIENITIRKQEMKGNSVQDDYTIDIYLSRESIQTG
jgi:hypothetical protein